MLSSKYSGETELKWQAIWDKGNFFKFQEDSSLPIYSIDTPPPFTSGKLHMGHVLSYSYFDFLARYKRMKGFNVLYPQGWDAQGFPTEVKVEAKYGKLNPSEFRKKCEDFSLLMIENMRRQMKSMGFSADWGREYITMSKSYHKLVQLSVLKMFSENYIYREKHPVLWCTKCKSAIAKAETEEIELETDLVYFNFNVEGAPLAIASTRPELLHACVAVLVNNNDARYNGLEGKFAETPFGKKVKIIFDKDVDSSFGTGAVMVCTYGDKNDVVWQKRYNLEVINGITEYGTIINSNICDGLKIKEARQKTMDLLRQNGSFVKSEKISHSVKIHDRCKSEVEPFPSMEWFARVKENSDFIKKIANEIKWVPEFGIHYLTDWLDNIDWDWVISRDRIFGTPIPFYLCTNCSAVKPVDEADLPFYPENAKERKCEFCSSIMLPEKKVFDVWIDSSITPLIISGWMQNSGLFQKAYPTSLRPQGVEIVRTWAFYTIFRSGVALAKKKPWDSIILNGNVLAPDGKKMSKSLGNVIDPDELLKEYPADAIRQWAAMSGAMAKDRPFSFEDLKFAKQFLNKLWNAARFSEQFLSDYSPSGFHANHLKSSDKWILSRTSSLIKEQEQCMENSDFRSYIVNLQNFIWNEFCDYYLEYAKPRLYEGTEEEKLSAKFVLYHVFDSIARLLNPISPHISEEINSEVLKNSETLVFAKWPELNYIYKEEEAIAVLANEAMRQIREFKAKNKLSMNAELSEVSLLCKSELGSFAEEIQKTGKVKELKILVSPNTELKLEFKF